MNKAQSKAFITKTFRRQHKTIDENDIITLTNEQEAFVSILKEAIFDEIDDNRIRLVYRGEKNTRISKRIFGSDDSIAKHTLYSHIFLVGGKAEWFFKNENDSEPAAKDLDIKFESLSAETVEMIFHELNEICTLRKVTEDQRQQIHKLKNKNREFIRFFSNKSNLKCFIEAVDALSDRQRYEITEYYLYILHVLGKANLSRFSIFVSTSYSFKTAKSFANQRRSTADHPFVYIYTIEQPFTFSGVCSDSIDYYNSYSGISGIPLLNTVFFKGEEEFAVKRALFPHRIIGIVDMDTGEVIFNPKILLPDKQAIRAALRFGVDPGHDNWDEEIVKYNYRAYTEKFRDTYSMIRLTSGNSGLR